MAPKLFCEANLVRAINLFVLPIMLLGISTLTARAAEISLKTSVPHVTVIGSAEIEVVPDRALLWIGVMTERKTAADASSDNAKSGAGILDEIKAQGIEARDIKTTSASLNTVYDAEREPDGRIIKNTFRGYQAREDFSILVRDVTKAGKLAQLLIDKGANQFRGITFQSSKERETRRNLQGEAMRDAMAQAASYTGAIGMKLGGVIQIGEDEVPMPDGEADLPSRQPPFSQTVATVSIPIEPGVERVTASIRVTWEITSGP
jgi:uncharacterized protein YggE